MAANATIETAASTRNTDIKNDFLNKMDSRLRGKDENIYGKKRGI